MTRALGIATVAAAFAAIAAAPAVAADAVAKPTFTKDIAPIFQEKCEACHRTDSIAPMSLVTYEEARPWARSIKSRVAARQMPPWHIDKTVGIQDFKNDRSLSDAQVETIVRWVDQGAPKGDPKDMPAPRVWPNEQGWNFTELFG
jgi:mono/diheme cytochrome c family protein